MSLLPVFSGEELCFQHYLLLLLLKHAGPDLEMSFLCLKAHVQAQHNSASWPIFLLPFFGKTETYELLQENQLGSTSVDWLKAYIY